VEIRFFDTLLPRAEITHLGGQSVGRFRFGLPWRLIVAGTGLLEALRSEGLGESAGYLLNLGIRFAGYNLLNLSNPTRL